MGVKLKIHFEIKDVKYLEISIYLYEKLIRQHIKYFFTTFVRFKYPIKNQIKRVYVPFKAISLKTFDNKIVISSLSIELA